MKKNIDEKLYEETMKDIMFYRNIKTKIESIRHTKSYQRSLDNAKKWLIDNKCEPINWI